MLTVLANKNKFLMGRLGWSSMVAIPCIWPVYCIYGTIDNEPLTFIIGPAELILVYGNVLQEIQGRILTWKFVLVLRHKTSVS